MYLKNMSSLVRKFKFENCYAYDKAFRTLMAAESATPAQSKTCDWLHINDELYNLYLRDAYLPGCFHCSSYGHFISNCPYYNKSSKRLVQTSPGSAAPSRPTSIQPLSSPYTYTSSSTFRGQQQPISALPALPAPGANSPCGRYNRTGFCSKPPCTFPHVCNKCNRPGHPGFRCFTTATTPFRN